MSYGVMAYATDLVLMQHILEGHAPDGTTAEAFCRKVLSSQWGMRLQQQYIVTTLGAEDSLEALAADFADFGFRYSSFTTQAAIYSYLFEAMCAYLGRPLDNRAWYPSGDAVNALAIPSSGTVFDRIPEAGDFPLRYIITRTKIPTVRDLNRQMSLPSPLAKQNSLGNG
jgi:hypothetical protein